MAQSIKPLAWVLLMASLFMVFRNVTHLIPVPDTLAGDAIRLSISLIASWGIVGLCIKWVPPLPFFLVVVPIVVICETMWNASRRGLSLLEDNVLALFVGVLAATACGGALAAHRRNR